MKRLVVLLMSVTIALTALASVALARTIDGTSGDDNIFGTNNRDIIRAGDGDDRVFGLRGGDQITGGPGNDILAGNAGNDRIYAQDGEADVISCGSGFDLVYADSIDTFEDRTDCEKVQIDDDTTPPGGEEGTDCSDNIDNDGDGDIDFPEDTGCSGPEDNTENSGGGGGGKVTFCHKPDTPAEKTMTLPRQAVQGHLGHGDTLGPCDGDKSDNRANKKRS